MSTIIGKKKKKNGLLFLCFRVQPSLNYIRISWLCLDRPASLNKTHCRFFPSSSDSHLTILVRIRPRVAGSRITFTFQKVKQSPSHGFVECLLSTWQESREQLR